MRNRYGQSRKVGGRKRRVSDRLGRHKYTSKPNTVREVAIHATTYRSPLAFPLVAGSRIGLFSRRVVVEEKTWDGLISQSGTYERHSS